MGGGDTVPFSPHSFPDRQEKEAWIHAKYVEKKFLTKLPEIRGRRGGRGPPRGQPPVPPKPGNIRPRPGSFRSKPGIGVVGLGSQRAPAVCLASWDAQAEAQAFRLRTGVGRPTAALVLPGKRFRDYCGE